MARKLSIESGHCLHSRIYGLPARSKITLTPPPMTSCSIRRDVTLILVMIRCRSRTVVCCVAEKRRLMNYLLVPDQLDLQRFFYSTTLQSSRPCLPPPSNPLPP